ncbi:hypothetical protein HC251_22805 [Iamia sp. SCSIO 61187]|uniref:hypothetical protein n=1 Tax=Iamia sp. SCSIO 61187 TaxID=2722752 RepID=UPI001C636103|nr:hypothetical protein [Iamia sp. SCSIO 61187]QYG94980.1 hypothetical protein HC251_22805 [Iamia sp. SCSIO 61187]
MDGPGGPQVQGDGLSSDERAAVRAYLQRSEVRLSTVHRVASALLSGAGLMVLLPAVARDSVVDVVHALVRGSVTAPDVLLLVAVGTSLALPVTALLFLLRDLTQFYFHANHIRHETGETFTPRLTLTALRLPADELGPEAAARLDAARRTDAAVELLVPANVAARARVDRRLTVYGLGDAAGASDVGRAGALFTLAASHPRDLLEEVAKVEHGMVRHVLRGQTIVLRYVKALLALLTTAMATFAAAAVVDRSGPLGVGDRAWLAGILLVWAPVVVVAVTAPVRWLESQLRSDGATHTAVSDDPELTHVEVVAIRLALVGLVAAGAAMALSLGDGALSDQAQVWGAGALAGSVVVTFAALWGWAGSSAPARLVSRT